MSAELTKKDRLDQLWSEHAQRHAVFWATYWRWATFLFAIQAVPYLNDLVRRAMGQWVLILPVASALGAFALAVLLGAEYVRILATDNALTQVRGALPEISHAGLGRLFALPVGWLAIGYLIIGILVTSAGNFLVLQQVLRLDST